MASKVVEANAGVHSLSMAVAVGVLSLIKRHNIFSLSASNSL
jgi:hypothetical protein